MSVRARAARGAHLVRRAWESVRARPLDDATGRWVAGALEPGELEVWNALGPVDQREGVATARRLGTALAGTPETSDPRWRAAALLHDAGKPSSGFGTPGRVVVTVVAAGLGAPRVRGWVDARSRLPARMGRYIAHDELGAALLERAGARREVVAWARAHHRPALWEGTGIPAGLCRALAAADGEPPE